MSDTKMISALTAIQLLILGMAVLCAFGGKPSVSACEELDGGDAFCLADTSKVIRAEEVFLNKKQE